MIVGMVGKKRSGKDSFAQTLTTEGGFERRAFADPLKRAVWHLDPIVGRVPLPGALAPYQDTRLRTVVQALGWEGAKEIPEVRRVLQEYGVSIREIDPEFWVRATVSTMRTGVDYVVTDVRFPNEVAAVRELGGVIVRVNRPGLDSTDTHVSETALDDLEPDFFATNDSTLEELAEQARTLLDLV